MKVLKFSLQKKCWRGGGEEVPRYLRPTETVHL